MKTYLLKTALLLFSTSILISCDSDNNDGENLNYKLESIVWKTDNTTKDETYEIEYPDQIFKNTGSSTLKMSVNAYDGLKETSKFQTDDKDKLNKWKKMKDTLVCVPTYFEVLSSEYKPLVTNQKAPLYIGAKIDMDPIAVFIYDLKIEPGKQARYKSTIVFEKRTATYKSRFTSENKDSDSDFELSGIWEGIVIVKPKVSITYENISK